MFIGSTVGDMYILNIRKPRVQENKVDFGSLGDRSH